MPKSTIFNKRKGGFLILGGFFASFPIQSLINALNVILKIIGRKQFYTVLRIFILETKIDLQYGRLNRVIQIKKQR